MPKLILINPVGKKSGYLMSSISRFAPLGLAYIAAVTPNHWDIEIIDENFVDFQYQEADLVGITAFKSKLNLDVPVTMAGLLLTTLPMLILYIAFQRFFIRGLTEGATKG